MKQFKGYKLLMYIILGVLLSILGSIVFRNFNDTIKTPIVVNVDSIKQPYVDSIKVLNTAINYYKDSVNILYVNVNRKSKLIETNKKKYETYIKNISSINNDSLDSIIFMEPRLQIIY